MKNSTQLTEQRSMLSLSKLVSGTVLTVFSILLLSSCEKVADLVPEETETTSTSPASPQIVIHDADAIFIALQTVSYSSVGGFPIETTIGLPVAMVFDGANFKDVGGISCESNDLTKQANNSYIFIPSATDPLGITYDNETDWSVLGGNGFPGGVYSAKGSFPSNVEIDAVIGQDVDTKSYYVLSTKLTISNADSVYFGIHGPSGSVQHVMPGNSSTLTFSEAEMASIGTGSGFIQIAAMKQVKREELSTGEVIYYLTEKVSTSMVTLK